MSRPTTMIGTAFAAVATAAALALTPTATADPARPAASTSPLAKTQEWLHIYNGPVPPDADAVELRVAIDPTFGMRVTDHDGRSLYRLGNDAEPTTWTCNGDCATMWPPLLIGHTQNLYAYGVDPELTGYVERADGSCQLTIAGRPAYYYSGDHTPGDLLGQGIGGVWSAIGPTGEKAPPG